MTGQGMGSSGCPTVDSCVVAISASRAFPSAVCGLPASDQSGGLAPTGEFGVSPSAGQGFDRLAGDGGDEAEVLVGGEDGEPCFLGGGRDQ